MFNLRKSKDKLLHESNLTEQLIKAEIPGAKQIHLIGETVYNEADMEEIRRLVRKGDIPALSSFNSPDVMQDIIQAYLVVDDTGQSHLVALIDPFELYMDPYIIERKERIKVDPME